MAKLTLAIVAIAGAVAFAGAAWADCPAHDMTVKNDTPQTVVDGTTAPPPSAPSGETKTGG